MTISSITDILYNWQTLVGSTIGIILPISFWYLKELYEAKKEHKRNLIYLEKYLVNAINSIYDTKYTIEKFLSSQFKGLKENIKERSVSCYSTDNAFFPYIGKEFINYEILSLNTKSGYLDNKMALVLRNLKDLSESIDDTRRQFTSTVDKNEKMVFKKLNLPSEQNDMYLRNLQEFEKMINSDMIEKNLKTAIYTLVSTRTILLELRKMGIIKWKSKFAGTYFRYFKNKKELNKFKEKTADRMDKYFEEKIVKEIENLEKDYKKW